MSENISTIYQDNLNKYELKVRSIQKKLDLIAFTRLAVFILMLVVPFLLLQKGIIIAAAVIFTTTLILFTYLLTRNQRLSHLHKYYEALVKINQNELHALKGNLSLFDSGTAFISSGHDYTWDLDIFGDFSVFQMLNRTALSGGAENLANKLRQGVGGRQEILSYQSAIKDLTTRLHWRQSLMAEGIFLPADKEDREKLIKWIGQPPKFIQRKAYFYLLLASTLLTASSLILYIFSLAEAGWLILALLTEMIIYSQPLKSINKIHNEISGIGASLGKYSSIMKKIEDEDFGDTLLRRQATVLKSENLRASSSIRTLRKTIDGFDNRSNLAAGIILNLFFMWDLRHVLKIEKWRVAHENYINSWFETIYEIDACCSLANFACNNPGYAFPSPDENGPVISAANTGHPLLAKEERVCNDFSISKNGSFVIITGANMAGKSTFLRTIGVNLVLAKCGAPVCAATFSFQPANLYTSMRTSDSIKKHESYFHAELKRLKTLIDKLREGEKIFVILDEILKGTNTTDKQQGSKAILKKLVQLGASGIIATHDLSLGETEKEIPGKVSNQCFEIEIEGEHIGFDYKLYPGITKKMNASLLMHKMGLID